jgi:predicted nucleic acid-binding protein
VIYIDSSVVLADLLTEHRNPTATLWRQDLVSSRLLEYEIWNRIHVRKPTPQLADRARFLIEHIDFIEMTPAVLARALSSFPLPLRTLDALHVASLIYMHQTDETISLASYDRKMQAAAEAFSIPLYQL